MLEIYWGCLIGGSLFTLLAVVIGEVAGGGHHDLPHGEMHGGDHLLAFLRPTVIVSAITAFGGAGILLSRYGPASAAMGFVLALGAGIVVGLMIYFFYIKPMRKTENSVGYSMNDLVGMTGEVLTPIPERGYGEVIVKVGASHTAQIAASFDSTSIPSGSTVVVVQADRDTLYVTSLDIH